MSTLATSIRDGIGFVELNRPEVRNAINAEMARELTALLEAWAAKDELKALVFSGAGGKAFAGGADVSELRERTHREAFFAIVGSVLQRLEDFPRPTLAAIDGYALGGGLELALACDLRVASKTAKVGLPETTLGIFPAAGGTWRLPRLVGLGRAKDLVFTGRILDADEAFALGLFERLVDRDALGEATQLAAQIAQQAPLAVQVAKLSLNSLARGADPSTVERLGQALLNDSAEKNARMTSFLNKRAKKPKGG
jgi:enoyl-CoA hydratase